MNLEVIPKAFWYAISLSLLISTSGLTYISYKAGNFTIKYKEAEFFADGNAIYKAQLDTQAKNIEEQTKTLRQREVKIEKLEELAKTRLEQLESAKHDLKVATSQMNSCESDKAALENAKINLNNILQLNESKVKEANEAIASLELLKGKQQVQQQQLQIQQLQIQQQQQQQQQIQQQMQSRY